MAGMNDTKPEADEIPLTPKDRAVVNEAVEIAKGFAELAYGTASEAVGHFAAAARWQAVAKQAGAEP